MALLDAAPLVVNGQRCTLHTLSHEELSKSPLLQPIVQMQNRAFASGSRQPILPENSTRYYSIEQYLSDTGAGATTFVLASESGEEIYGAVSIRKYVDVDLDALAHVHPAQREFTRPPLGPAPASEARWLLCCLAVSPAVQKQGLAGRLLALAEAYAIAQSKDTSKVVRVMLCCIKENNGAYYARRGYCVAEERRLPSGFLGSEAGFTIVFMDKFINSQTVGIQD